jgi:tryptophan-rich sensory protein
MDESEVKCQYGYGLVLVIRWTVLFIGSRESQAIVYYASIEELCTAARLLLLLLQLLASFTPTESMGVLKEQQL